MNAVNDFHILMACGCDDSAVIDHFPESNIKKRDINNGKRLKDDLNTQLKLSFSENYPENMKLYDFVENSLNFLIISHRAKVVLDAEKVKHVEFVPIMLVDHKKNVLEEEYYIVNFLERQPIIDMDKSEYDLSFLGDLILNLKQLHIDISDVDNDATLFRATTKRSTNFIREDLLQALKTAGITGIKTVPAEGWDGNTFSF